MYGNNDSLQVTFSMDGILLLSEDISDHVAKSLETVLKIDVKALSSLLCIMCIND